jgi:hypothetical protein
MGFAKIACCDGCGKKDMSNGSTPGGSAWIARMWSLRNSHPKRLSKTLSHDDVGILGGNASCLSN